MPASPRLPQQHQNNINLQPLGPYVIAVPNDRACMRIMQAQHPVAELRLSCLPLQDGMCSDARDGHAEVAWQPACMSVC
ncbi:hypothetical protein M440DRAFT_1398594 [Trichoderma longibrachiatum ATCC 18648]|uniref:Uncharacterized protein n=1 Tax=Trichoderma longibrachiatum ATCC 18648 TaxID=983965 RepID=A0A2T4CCQ9_TRILO|nr:hypothetical protein M440DRAFT_1398594 [Trichoderma longibrachiatum ATCC 18648]